MSAQQPPRLATWLLQRLLYARHKQSLIGDLAQIYAERQSAAWYWRQTFGALAIGLLQWMRDHGTSLAIASAAAWMTIAIWHEINDVLITHSGAVYWSLRRSLDSSPALMVIWSLGALLRILCFGLAGWIAARLHPRSERITLGVIVVTILWWRMPWSQVQFLEPSLLLLAHYGSAIGGLVIGGWLARRSADRVQHRSTMESSRSPRQERRD